MIGVAFTADIGAAAMVIAVLLGAGMVALIVLTRYRGERGQRATTITWDNRSEGNARG